MFTMTRRTVLGSAVSATAFGLAGKLEFVPHAFAETSVEPTSASIATRSGPIEVTAIYDGIWRKPHDPAFIANASVDETKAALANAGLPTEFMPIPFTVVVLKVNDRLIMMDAGSGVGQWQANATHLPANMAAAGIDYKKIDTIMISHFHPDHVWGLMEKGTNTPVFPNAELIVNATEYNWWTDPSRARKVAGRPQAGRQAHRREFPKWKNWKLVERWG